MHLTIIGGEPGAGKTYLMRHILRTLGMSVLVREKMLCYHHLPQHRAYVLGDYLDPRETFAGTDRLSMGVQPVALRWVQGVAQEEPAAHVLLEGDRLFNGKFIKAAAAVPGAIVRVVALLVPPGIQRERFKERGSDQDVKFLRGRATKLANMQKAAEAGEYSPAQWFTRVASNDPAETAKLVEDILRV